MKKILPASANVWSPTVRWLLAALLIMIVLGLLGGAISIPFFFESASIKYKVGLDKTLLRLGKVFGMAAGLLLLLQLGIGARVKLLDRVLALDRLFLFHRVNAFLIAALALLHPLLVFAPEDIAVIPVKLEYWPEIGGAFLLLLILLILTSGIWRLFLELPFHRWWIMHRMATALAVAVLMLHVLFVSETFEDGWPRMVVFAALGIYLALFLKVRLKPIFLKIKAYRVTDVRPVGNDAFLLELAPKTGKVFNYLPGQFAFIRVRSEMLSAEEHPFSMISTPTRPAILQFVIRCYGDWTRDIGRLKAGDPVAVDGPFGLFSHLARPYTKELVMIAGGIGITPILSMLRYLSDVGDERKILLIWSNQTGKDVILPAEFLDIQSRLTNLRLKHIFTRDPQGGKENGRLNQAGLKELLTDFSKQAVFFICGPRPMMHDIRQSLADLGYLRRKIYLEEFRL